MPRITISITAPDDPADSTIVSLDLPPGLTILDLKNFVHSETKFPVDSQQFYLNGSILNADSKTLEEVGLNDGDMLALLINRPRRAAHSHPAAMPRNAADEIETIRLRILGDQNALTQIQQGNPQLAAAINDPNRWREEWSNARRDEQHHQREHQRQLELLNADPFDVEAQAKIEEIIRQERVIENLQHAYEHIPEVFGRVSMLYIDCEINNHRIKALVDSGAQATIMSPGCAEACGIMRLIDKRFSGIARGVGTAKILGRVHHTEIRIGGAAMPCAFTVMEGKAVDLLFGLDMLKRYKAKIDLEKNALCFEGIEVPFLPESEIPDSFAEEDEPTVPGPNGMEVGAKTGAVKPAGDSSSAAAGPSGSGSGASGAGPSNASPAGRQQPPQPPPGSKFAPADIERLTELGVSKAQAINALEACNGDVEAAASILFQMM